MFSCIANTTFDDWTMYTLQTVRNCPLEVLVLQSIASLTTYIIGKFACKVQIQTFSFSTPINLVAPVAFTLIMTACGKIFLPFNITFGNHLCSVILLQVRGVGMPVPSAP